VREREREREVYYIITISLLLSLYILLLYVCLVGMRTCLRRYTCSHELAKGVTKGVTKGLKSQSPKSSTTQHHYMEYFGEFLIWCLGSHANTAGPPLLRTQSYSSQTP
jgi:hypothetical protein